MNVGAWAENVPSEELLDALLAIFRGQLGVVIGPHQANWATDRRAFVILNRPGPHLVPPSDTLAILGADDEPNKIDPATGEPRQSAAHIAAQTNAARAAFPHHQVAPGGLANVGTWREVATDRTHLDLGYWLALRQRTEGPWAVNMGATRLDLVKRALRRGKGPWIVCGLPRRPAWRPRFAVLAWIVERLVGVKMRDWLALAKRPDVLAITFWVLLQDGDQTDFGIFAPKRGGGYRLTDVGKRLYRELVGGGAFPEVPA